ncbi:hypothetical protein CEXT_447071 [Caerostris extrusa]|uniref:Uncharacterized protein n=1 Tax=Caerostris extrusa TaxID=172846 RepID=A0AAV4TW78_CAEEX|nr:hypothetical protein CEXT_447071 [Caerostris extrusa]
MSGETWAVLLISWWHLAFLYYTWCQPSISSSQSQQHGQQQAQHHSLAYLIPSPITRQSGLGGALSGLGGFGGGLGGGGGLSSILSGLGGLSGSSMLSTALPLLMVVGLGAMLVPLLGGAFFRESQKRGLPSVSPAFLRASPTSWKSSSRRWTPSRRSTSTSPKKVYRKEAPEVDFKCGLNYSLKGSKSFSSVSFVTSFRSLDGRDFSSRVLLSTKRVLLRLCLFSYLFIKSCILLKY